MTTRRVDRTQRCGLAEARIRLTHAQTYFEVAELLLAEDGGGQATVATGNAVLAAIAAADAICCAAYGARYRGTDHRRAADLLEKVTGDKKLAGLLRELVDYKDMGHYGLSNIVASRAKAAVRKAGQILDAARTRVR